MNSVMQPQNTILFLTVMLLLCYIIITIMITIAASINYYSIHNKQNMFI